MAKYYFIDVTVSKAQNVVQITNHTAVFHRIISPVDGKSMEGTQSEKAPQCRDFEREGKVMKCTEVSELRSS